MDVGVNSGPFTNSESESDYWKRKRRKPVRKIRVLSFRQHIWVALPQSFEVVLAIRRQVRPGACDVVLDAQP